MPDISQMEASIKENTKMIICTKWIESYRELCRCISHREDGACTWTDVCGRRISDTGVFPINVQERILIFCVLPDIKDCLHHREQGGIYVKRWNRVKTAEDRRKRDPDIQ